VALRSTVFKAVLDVADIERQNYGEFPLTLARHPSETDERMMVRVVVFALHAHERLIFGKGVSDPDEPDLWRKDLTGAVEEWIELGQPDEKAVLRACGKASAAFVYCYGGGAMPWWKSVAEKLARPRNLVVRKLDFNGELSTLADKSMRLQATIQDGQVLLSNEAESLTIDYTTLRGS
jgi:uncharacterized protein YaeQ